MQFRNGSESRLSLPISSYSFVYFWRSEFILHKSTYIQVFVISIIVRFRFHCSDTSTCVSLVHYYTNTGHLVQLSVGKKKQTIEFKNCLIFKLPSMHGVFHFQDSVSVNLVVTLLKIQCHFNFILRSCFLTSLTPSWKLQSES